MSLTLSYTTHHNVNISDGAVAMLTICYEYNRKIQAIKYIRFEYELPLKEAKDMVDQFWCMQDGQGIKQHWSTKHLGEPDTRCYNCYPPERSETLGDLLRNKLDSFADSQAVNTQGYKAQAAGKDLVKDNPYPESDRDNHWGWRSGYLDAVRDSR